MRVDLDTVLAHRLRQAALSTAPKPDPKPEPEPEPEPKPAPPKEPSKPGDDGLDRSADFIDFIYENPTVFHACDYFCRLLKSHGFVYLSERESWKDKIKAGGKYYTTRNGSSLIAFDVGPDWVPGNGYGIVGCHLDANCLRLKPASVKPCKDGFRQLGVAPYGSGVESTWWDRDLAIGGRVIVKTTDSQNNVSYSKKLVYIRHPVARIPTLAPHFGAPSRGPFNPETQMVPIVGLDEGDGVEPTEGEKECPLIEKHDIQLLRAIAQHAKVQVKDMVQMELELFDCQRGAVGGLTRQLLFCPRLDDKLCSYAAIYGLIRSSESSGSNINAVALFDDEEIGSLLRQGAKGHFLEAVVSRVNATLGGDDQTQALTYANSFFVSSDVTHAVNPNFSDVYLENHKPKLNTGMVIKLDSNGHTTSDAVSTALIEEVARRTGNTLQYFHIRNDSRSGGTIGPALSSATGMRAVDMGIPQLSMHSIRATTGSKDVSLGMSMFKAFFTNWAAVDGDFRKGDL